MATRLARSILARDGSRHTHRVALVYLVPPSPTVHHRMARDRAATPSLFPIFHPRSPPSRARSCNLLSARGGPRANVHRWGTADTPTYAQRQSFREGARRMIRVAMEVRGGATLLRETVSAESVRQAVSVMRERHPGRDVRVVFPISPEDFFLEDPEQTVERRAGV